MVPAAFVTLERLPLTPNGKVDRRALPEASTEAPAAVAPAHLRRGAGRRGVARAARRRAIDVLDNFLDLGGHSLLIMRAVAMLESRTGMRLSPRAFVFQTLAQLARESHRRRRAGRGRDGVYDWPGRGAAATEGC